MPGAAGQLKALWKQLIGGVAPSGSASSTGDVSQMVKYVAAGSVAGYASAKKVSGSGYLVWPAAATAVGMTGSATPWVLGAYSEVVASTAEAEYIIGLNFGGSSNTNWEVVIATGGAGSESVKATVSGGRQTGAGQDLPVFFPYPIAVPAGTRIACAARTSSASGTPSVKLLYVRQSELVAL